MWGVNPKARGMFIVVLLVSLLFSSSVNSLEDFQILVTDSDGYATIEISGPPETPFSLTILDGLEQEILTRTSSTSSSGSYFISVPMEKGSYVAILRSGQVVKTSEFAVGNSQDTQPVQDSPTAPNITTNETTPRGMENETQNTPVQMEAEIGKPVRWVKFVESLDSAGLPEEAENILRRQVPGGYEIEYETPGPEKKERFISEHKKEVTVSSGFHYKNVKSYTSLPEIVPEGKEELIKITWVGNGPVKNAGYLDENSNGLIDRVEWVVPHLSNQTFEIEITVLNVQSYPTVGGNWTVMFETLGTANLTVTAVNGTTWSDSRENGDLRFLELKCGGEPKNYEWKNGSVFIEDYSCGETGHETSKVLTSGKHYLEFDFGGRKAYASNDADMYETGFVETSGWTLVSTKRIYSDPVVVAAPKEGGEIDMDHEVATAIVRSLDGDSFEVIIMNDTGHTVNGNVSYIVVEEGSHVLSNGMLLQAGRYEPVDYYDCEGENPSNWMPITFHESYGANPVVVASPNNNSANDWMAVRYDSGSLSTSGVSLSLERDEGEGSAPLTASPVNSIGWIAMNATGATDMEAALESGVDEDPNTGDWRTLTFSNSYTTPLFFAILEEASGTDPCVVGKRNLASGGVDIRLTESRTDSGSPEQQHAIEDVLWMAFENDLGNAPPTDPQDIECNGSTDCNIKVNKLVELNASGSTDSDGDNITYFIEANLSNTLETGDQEAGTVQILGEDAEAIGEWGKDTLSDSWKWISFENTYSDPVVIVKRHFPAASTGDPSVSVRMKDAGPTGFNVTLQLACDSGTVGTYDIYWLAIEEGNHTLSNNMTVEAWKYETSTVGENSNWVADSKSYNFTYSTMPLVFHQVMTYDDPTWISTWVSSVGNKNNPPTASGFQIGLNGAECVDSHGTETIGYIVVENTGSGTMNGMNMEANDCPEDSPDGYREWSLDDKFTLTNSYSGSIWVLADQVEMDGGNGGWGVISSVSTTQIGMGDLEDRADSERTHISETFVLMAFDDTSGNFYSNETSNDEEATKDWETYGSVSSETWLELNELEVTVYITKYSDLGSSSNGNKDPTLQLEMYNGSGWEEVGNFTISGLYGTSLSTTDSSILNAWLTQENTDLRMRGVNFDYYSPGAYDEIEYSGVWVSFEGTRWVELGNHTNETLLQWNTTDLPEQSCVNLRAKALDQAGGGSDYYYEGCCLEINHQDFMPPEWSNNQTDPASGSAYSPGAAYQFNVTWVDEETDVDTVVIEHNFTGGSAAHNDTVSTNDGDVYYFDASDLAVGTYVWREHASNTDGYWNVTNGGSYWVYTVTKATPSLSFPIKPSSQVQYETETNVTCSISSGDAGTTLTLHRNGSMVDQGSGFASESGVFGVGIYNYSCDYAGSENYTPLSVINNYLNVTKRVTQTYLWINGTRADSGFVQNDYANFTAELVGYTQRDSGNWTNYTTRTCTDTWGSSCDSDTYDNAFGSCDGTQFGLANVHEVYVNGTNFTSGDAVEVNCYLYDAGRTDVEIYFYYSNGTGWVQKSSQTSVGCTDCNYSASFELDDVEGTHYVRCIEDLDGENDECADAGSHYDNDDVNLTVWKNDPGSKLEIWTNYSDGSWKLWDTGSSPLENLTQLTTTGNFTFLANYSGSGNYTYSEESWDVLVSSVSLESHLVSLSPASINQTQNATVVGNCTCVGGICNNVFMEVLADNVKISNTSGSDLQANGSNPMYIGTLNDDFAVRAWNITGWESGQYSIKIKCNSSETGNKFSGASSLEVNDTTYPKWSLNSTSPASGSQYVYGRNYQFNITWEDNENVGTVLIEHNLTGSSTPHNDTVSTSQGSEWYFEASDLPAGTYVYRWHANDTSGNMNSTPQNIYAVSKGTPGGSLTNTKPWTVTYPTEVTIGYSESNQGDGDCSYVVWRNGTGAGSGETWTPAADTYWYKLNVTGCGNYTDSELDEETLTVQKNSSNTCSLTSSNGWSYFYGGSTNLTCTCTGDGTAHLYFDNVERDEYNNTLRVFSANEAGHGVACNITSGENYTPASNSSSLVIYRASTITRLFMNGTEGDRDYNYTSLANLTARSSQTFLTVSLYGNFSGYYELLNSSVGTTMNITDTTNLDYGDYEIKANTSENENYSSSQVTYTMGVVDYSPPTYSLNSTNSTRGGEPVEMRLRWKDSELGGYAFSFCNGSWNGLYCVRNQSSLYETGIVENLKGWTLVNFTNTYTDPVVIVTGQQGADLSFNVESSRPVIRNVTSKSFEVRVLNHMLNEVTEDMGFIAMEKGHHTIDGVEVEAGTYSVTGTSAQAVSFAQAFPGSTVVVDTAQNETFGGGDPQAASSRFTSGSMTSTGYTVYWEGFDTDDDISPFTAGYIAVESGSSSGWFESGIYPSCDADPADGQWCDVSFGNTYDKTPLIFLNPVSESGGDPCVAGRRNLNSSGLQVRITEGLYGDSDLTHNAVDVPWIAWFDTNDNWEEDGWQAFPTGGTKDWSNVTKVTNDTWGSWISWKVAANDSEDTWGYSDVYDFKILPEISIVVNTTAGPSGGTNVSLYNSTGHLVAEGQGNLTASVDHNKLYDVMMETDLAAGGQKTVLENINASDHLEINSQIVESYAGTLPESIGSITPVYAQDELSLGYDYATVYLPKGGVNVSHILHCTDWDYSIANCSSWEVNETSDYNFQENTTHIWFNVTEFDGYGGGEEVWLEANLNRPLDNTVVPWLRNFTVNATVFCRNGTCGTVNGTVRYNASGTYPDTNVSTNPGDPPFYTFDPNPQTCGSMSQNENCTLTWKINSTGSLGGFHEIGVLFFIPGYQVENHTQNSTVETGKILIMNLTFDTVDFGLLDPGDTEQPGLNNSDNYYNVSIDPNSNDLDNLWINGSDLTGQAWPNYFIKPQNISWSFTDNPSTGSPLAYSYSLMDTDVKSGQNLTTYYWINVPYGIMTQNYAGQITIKANASW